jgi:hypothetical protein
MRPTQQTTRGGLIVNLKAAKALGRLMAQAMSG